MSIDNNYDKAYDYIIEHQQKRFKELNYILDKTSETVIIIPGKEPSSDKSKRYHNLGTDLAKPEDEYAQNGYNRMLKNLDDLVSDLFNKYSTRVKFGNVGEPGRSDKFPVDDDKKPSYKHIHVWGANEDNWNVGDGNQIIGDGQVLSFNNQHPGVFGIITTISNKTNKLDIFKEKVFNASNTNHLSNDDSRLYMTAIECIKYRKKYIKYKMKYLKLLNI